MAAWVDGSVRLGKVDARWYICSNCGSKPMINQYPDEYCPNCNQYMDNWNFLSTKVVQR